LIAREREAMDHGYLEAWMRYAALFPPSPVLLVSDLETVQCKVDMDMGRDWIPKPDPGYGVGFYLETGDQSRYEDTCTCGHHCHPYLLSDSIKINWFWCKQIELGRANGTLDNILKKKPKKK
jgi:hypothetical protein